MRLQEINNLIESVGVPSAYHHFEEGTGQQPPFICFYYERDNDFLADNSNYSHINVLTVELYTDNKDFTLEATLEGKLTGAGLVWSRTEDYIDSEKMYMVVYTTEVIING